MAARPSSLITLHVLVCSFSFLSFSSSFFPFFFCPLNISCSVGGSGFAVLYSGVHHHLLFGDPRSLQSHHQPHRMGRGGQWDSDEHLPGDWDRHLSHLHRRCLCGVVHVWISNANNFLPKQIWLHSKCAEHHRLCGHPSLLPGGGPKRPLLQSS